MPWLQRWVYAIVVLGVVAAAILWITPGEAEAQAPNPFVELADEAFPDSEVNPGAPTNGCGSQGADGVDVPDQIFDASFTPACDWHDKCYGTKGMSQAYCDTGMAAKTLAACTGSAVIKTCGGIAALYLAGVSLGGGDAYRDGQEAACGPEPADDARAHGDPHMQTFDGLVYDFMAAGEFTLMRDADSGQDLLQGRFYPWSDSESISIVTGIAMPAGDHVMYAHLDPVTGELEVGVDGHPIPGSLGVFDGGYVEVSRDIEGADKRVTLRSSEGLRVEGVVHSDRIDITVQLPRSLPYQIEGLLGDNDGDINNDLTDGQSIIAPSDVYDSGFASHWRITPDQSLFPPASSDVDYHASELEAFPTVIVTLFDFLAGDVDLARSMCEREGLEGLALDQCVFDVLVTGDDSYAGTSAASHEASQRIIDPGSFRAVADPSLVAAAAAGDLEAVLGLLDEGASVNAGRESDRATALIVAAQSGRTEIASALLERGAIPDLMTVDGYTALIYAARSREGDVVSMLIDAGASPDASAMDGTTALLSATQIRDLEMVDLLLDAGADADPKVGSVTPLAAAAIIGAEEIVDRLLAAGADPSWYAAGADVLQYGAMSGNIEVVRSLLSAGADPDGVQDAYPLWAAAASGNVDVVRLIVDAGADINAVPPDRLHALTIAASIGKVDIAKIFVEAGVDVNLTTSNGWTPLHFAAQSQSVDMVRYLLDQGADPNAEDQAGNTPAFYAIGDEVKAILSGG
ncbi:MAG: ankyrin repeat domain-containing protein [Actinomycetota bacterium]